MILCDDCGLGFSHSREFFNHACLTTDLAGPFGRPGYQTAAGVQAEAMVADPWPTPSMPPPNRLPESSEARKEIPLATGLLDYFPDALAAVAFVSKLGNDKHNPGEPLHWARGKSNDHADCIGRHLIDRGGHDAAGIRHSAQLAWRALALLQEELEAERGLAPSRGSK